MHSFIWAECETLPLFKLKNAAASRTVQHLLGRIRLSSGTGTTQTFTAVSVTCFCWLRSLLIPSPSIKILHKYSCVGWTDEWMGQRLGTWHQGSSPPNSEVHRHLEFGLLESLVWMLFLWQNSSFHITSSSDLRSHQGLITRHSLPYWHLNPESTSKHS